QACAEEDPPRKSWHLARFDVSRLRRSCCDGARGFQTRKARFVARLFYLQIPSRLKSRIRSAAENSLAVRETPSGPSLRLRREGRDAPWPTRPSLASPGSL